MTNTRMRVEHWDASRPPTEELYYLCQRIARQGENTVFRFVVSEEISVPFVPAKDRVPRLATRGLFIEVEIPVIGHEADKNVTMVTTDWEDGDDMSTTDIFWPKDAGYLSTQVQPEGDLAAFIKRQCAVWAYNEMKARLTMSPEDDHRVFDGIPDAIIEEINSMAVFMTPNGPHLARRLEGPIPRVKLAPNGVVGGNEYYNLVADARASERTWQDELLSFSLSDLATARGIRNQLCAGWCPQYDSESRHYRDMDTSISTGFFIGYELAHLDPPTASFEVGVRSLAEWMAEAGLATDEGLSRLKTRADGDADISEYVAMVQDWKNADPDAYDGALAKAGWTHPFDPVAIAELRHAAAMNYRHDIDHASESRRP